MSASTGVLNSSFGNGDGRDNDGIAHLSTAASSTTSSSEYIYSIALDNNGNLYAGGYTSGLFSGSYAGSNDAFILKMNASTGVLDSSFGNGDGADGDGIVQINASNSNSAIGGDTIYSIALDGNGNLYAGGYTTSSLSGTNAGNYDAFILKMSASTGVLDSSFGNGDGADGDGIVQINASNSNSATGTEFLRSIILDGNGNLYAGGYTNSSLSGTNAGDYDAFILKMSASTGLLDSSFGNGDGRDNDGIVQINATNSNSATGNDQIYSIALDGNGNLFASGFTTSSLSGANAGNNDAFILKMSASTGLLDSSFGNGDGEDNDGIVQINATNSNSATGHDYIYSIALDSSGNLYAGGYTASSLSGINAGSDDAFILKMSASTGVLDSSFGNGDGMDNDGILQINATNSNSATNSEQIFTIALDGNGNLYASGRTASSLSGTLAGGYDGIILKMSNSTGVLDTSFGNGDGMDNDGILQINAANSNSATSGENLYSIALDNNGHIYAGGHTSSPLVSNVDAGGGTDAFTIRISENE